MYQAITSLRGQEVDRGNEIINERELNTPDNIIRTYLSARGTSYE